MFNFKNGTALAIQQDQYLQLYRSGGKLSEQQIIEMEQNLWVATAAKMAPGNLVVRQWALIDLFKGTPDNKTRILNIMDMLSYRHPGEKRIWAEGYSYFNYTMDIVGDWVNKYSMGDVQQLVDKIKHGFLATAYLRNGLWYPAPFGDLRDIPLNTDLQIKHNIAPITISNVALNYYDGNLWYNISGGPLGLNTHIPVNSSLITIRNGIPARFKYYEGYDKKYKNSWEEFKDTFNSKRVFSIPL
jgi:hypothetical protein